MRKNMGKMGLGLPDRGRPAARSRAGAACTAPT
jgi:hypothetical protein